MNPKQSFRTVLLYILLTLIIESLLLILVLAITTYVQYPNDYHSFAALCVVTAKNVAIIKLVFVLLPYLLLYFAANYRGKFPLSSRKAVAVHLYMQLIPAIIFLPFIYFIVAILPIILIYLITVIIAPSISYGLLYSHIKQPEQGLSSVQHDANHDSFQS